MLASPPVRGVVNAATALAVVGFLAALIGIRFETYSVPHQPVWIASEAGTMPAVLYGVDPLARDPEAEALPSVVLVHGFACNKSSVGALARRLVRGGYAVLSPDLRGHGQNKSEFQLDFSAAGLRTDIEAAVSFAAGHPRLDSRRIAIAGHSMGATAVLDYAGHHPDVGAVIAISGAPPLEAPYTPPNPLMIWAGGDPELLRSASRWLATQYAEQDQVVLGRTYGDFERGSAVRTVEVDGTGHMSILLSDAAGSQILDWLDRTLGPGERSAARADRAALWSGVGVLSALILLIALGSRLAPLIPTVSVPERGTMRAFLLLLGVLVCAGGLLLSADAAAGVSPFGFLGLHFGQELVGLLALSGAGLWIVDWPRRRLRRDGLLYLRLWLALLLLWLAGYALLGAAVQGYQTMWLSPHRVWPALQVAVLCAPFFCAADWMLRRPGRWNFLSTGAAKLLVVGILMASSASGLMSMLSWFSAGTLLFLTPAFEVVCYGLYRSTPNPWWTGLLQAGWLGAAIAAISPLS